ncbi:RNA-binding protein RO60-like [Saccostrea echinata]|uniref:RNA-binding protein RO60-like n=1 Tax=Saccostrea echinata TaxID=191078 RepID=UPI002A80AB3C|nr:RNA-binding protein RO60-like [Saccostrea echinata]
MATAKGDLDMEAMETEFLGLQVNPKDCQSQDICISPSQVKNKAGGYVYKTDPETQLIRLIEEGSGEKVVQIIKEFSEKGRAYRQDTVLFALAVCCKSNDSETKCAGDFMKSERKKPNFCTSSLADIVEYLDKVEDAKKSKNLKIIVELILKYKLVREHIPTCFLNEKDVWKALIKHMPMTAMMRNLGKMSSLNLFRTKAEALNEISFEEQIVTNKLKNRELIHKAKIHPYSYLVALSKYRQGMAKNVNLSWPVCPHIADALEEGFYLSFLNITPTKKHFLLALDVTCDTHLPENVCEVDAHHLSALDAAIFMMVQNARTEPFCETILFSNDENISISVNPSESFHDLKRKVREKISNPRSPKSDVSLPFKYALERRKIVDVFVIFTNVDKSLGNVHPTQAMKFYKESSGKKDTRLIVCEMASSIHSVGDIEDHFTLTVSGFDSHVPKLINDFALKII